MRDQEMAASLTGILLALLGAGTHPSVVQECDQVRVYLEDGAELDAGERVARACCRSVRHLRKVFDTRASGVIRVRVLADMQAWRDKTNHPWYVGAALVGDEIVTQPASSLRRLENLEKMLTHELAHLFIRRSAGRNCPRWLDEGLSQWLAGQNPKASGNPEPAQPKNEKQLQELEGRMTSKATSRTQLERDYRTCLSMVRKLVKHVGIHGLLRALPGLKDVKDPLDLVVEGRTLRVRTFSRD
jgi:hypothetical protein